MSDRQGALREKLTHRVQTWFGVNADPQMVEGYVNELMADVGYAVREPGLQKVDPEAYAERQRAYSRESMRRRAASPWQEEAP